MSTQIKTFSRPVVTELRGAIKAALKTVSEEYGISLDFNNISYCEDKFTTKLEARIGGNSNEHAKADWDKHCIMFDLSPDAFGKQFEYAGSTYTIIGIKPRSSKYPVLATRVNSNKKYKFASTMVKYLKLT